MQFTTLIYLYILHRTRDFPAVVPPQLPSPSQQYPTQHVVHVIHHSKHHSKHSKHKHHHHSHADVSPSSAVPLPMPSPGAITASSSYQSGYGYVSSSPQQRVHFSHMRPPNASGAVDALALELKQKAVLSKPRKRTTSHPTLPAEYTYVNPNDAAHMGHTHGYVPDPRNPHFRYSECSGRRKALCVSSLNIYIAADKLTPDCFIDWHKLSETKE